MALVDSIIRAESGGNPNARNPRSSAAGLGQFIDSTWLSMLAKHRPDLATGKSPGELLALKSDPQLSRDMTAAYAADNAGILSKAGLPVTPGSTYLAHFAGLQGAVGILSADPSAPVAGILTPAAVKANPFLNGMTAADLRAWADGKVGGSTPAAAASTTTTAQQSVSAPMYVQRWRWECAFQRAADHHLQQNHQDQVAMPKLFDLVKVNIATTGTGTVTFGAAFSNSFLTPSEAGCVNSDSVRYVLVDGDDIEVGEGVIGGSVTMMTRTVVFSKIGGTKGTSKLNLSGTAYLYFTAISNDILNPSNNLSDVASANTSADNIGAYRKGTILGTVSQSSGVPTGAIIESGSNSNGNYVKYAGGTMICWGALVRTGVVVTGSGTTSGVTYESAAQTITFPATFSAGPSFTHSENSGNFMWTCGAGAPTTTQGKFWLVAASSEPSRNSHVCWQAIGRWY